MSLEDTIRGLTDAVNALNATLQSARVDVPAPQEVPPIPKLRPKVEAPKPLTKPEEPTTTGASMATSDSSATSESGPTTVTPTTEVTYDMVAKAITDTFPKDRAKVLAALAKFGAAKGPQLKPADYAAFLAELT
jgi:hypothetical protein